MNEPKLQAITVDERRLIAAGVPVFLLFTLIYGALFTTHLISPDLAYDWGRESQSENIYPVLVEQEYQPQPKRPELRALSDVTAGGQGALTEKQGFNTASPEHRLELGGNGQNSRSESRAAAEQHKSRSTVADGEAPSGDRVAAASNSAPPGEFKIPGNYTFREDIRLNFDGSGEISIPRQKFEDYEYFRRMLNKIRGSFAPPGANYVSHDYFGYTMQQTIKPQVIKTLFLIDQAGNVRDIRVIPPVVQRAVADSCVMALNGQNFGAPPPSVTKNGGVVGINFVFPPIPGR